MVSNVIDFNTIKKKKNNTTIQNTKAQEYLEQMTIAFNWGMDMLDGINTPYGFFSNYDATLYTVINNAYHCNGESIDDFLTEFKDLNEKQLIDYLKKGIELIDIKFIYDNKKFRYSFELYYKDILLAILFFPHKVAYLCIEDSLSEYETIIHDLLDLLELQRYHLHKLSKNKILKILNKPEINSIKSKINHLKHELIVAEKQVNEIKEIINSKETKMILNKINNFCLKHSIKTEI